MKLSKIAVGIEPSLTRKLFNMALQYDDVIDFTLGDPDFITPQSARDGAYDAISSGKTHYSANAGLIKLRNCISNDILSETGVNYNSNSEIIITVGAMEALYLSLLCVVDEGDEVIIPAPYWVNYEHIVKMCKGKAVIVPTYTQNNFVVNVQDIERAITNKTKAVIINSPNNPTGVIYDKNTVKEIAELAQKYDLLIYWDECYKSVVYDNNEVTSILDFENVKDNVVLINSFSKKFSMTGWRIGYAAAPAVMIEAMTKLQENIVACAPLPSQYAAIAALESRDESYKDMCREFQRRRDVLINNLQKTNILSCNIPQGTFYVFVDISKTGKNGLEFAYELLDNKHVAVVPGETYGEDYRNYVRIAFTVNESKIIEGTNRINEYVEGLIL